MAAMMIDVDPTALGVDFASGAALGALVGFVTKRIARIFAVIVGVQLVIVRYLESQGVLFINWEQLSSGAIETGTPDVNVHWLQSVLSTVTIGAGFVSGFFIGYRRG